MNEDDHEQRWCTLWNIEKSCHYESEDISWFEDINTHTHTAITPLAKGQLWQLDVTQLQLFSSSVTLTGREEGGYLGRDSSVTSHLLGMRNHFSCLHRNVSSNICPLLFSCEMCEGGVSWGSQVKAHVGPWPGVNSGDLRPLHLSLIGIPTPPRQALTAGPDTTVPASPIEYISLQKERKGIQNRQDWQLPHRLMCGNGFTDRAEKGFYGYV